MRRDTVVAELSRRLGRRELIWFGTRGDDLLGLSDLPNLSWSFSVINSYRGSVSVQSHSLEDFSGVRVDLDAHDIDEELRSEPIRALRAELLRALSLHCAVVTYRPSTFLSSACFTRSDALYLGMFKDHQSAFEHKPWVESAVARLDIPVVPWSYVGELDRGRVVRMLEDGPVMLRSSRSSGGAGISKVSDPTELATLWPEVDEAFLSVSPFLGETVPVNIGAVVWRDGVTVHLPSVQLIGHPDLTTREFGYAGNDFSLGAGLDAAVIDALEAATTRIGDWLRDTGFRGAFGLDFLVRDGVARFLEVNPRFQGSSHLSSRLSQEQAESCLMTDHLAALLGFDSYHQPPLLDRVRAALPASHFVVHWLAPAANEVDVMPLLSRLRQLDGFSHADVLLPARVACASNAPTCRVTLRRSVTTSGFDLSPDVVTAVETARHRRGEMHEH